jgi:LuxR family transcriptional activator of conjugal transfer of Ti plasmids
VQRVFQRFVERLNDSHDREAFHGAMAEAAGAFGLPCFAYLTMSRERRSAPALISSYPLAWTEHYLRSHYERLDPIILLAQRQTEPFDWSLATSDFDISRAQAQLFDEAAQFGIRCGFTVPIQYGREPVAAVTFAGDYHTAAFRRTVESNKRVLQLMAILLHSHARRKLFGGVHMENVKLTPREAECLRHAAQGKSRSDTAMILGMTPRGVKFHLDNVRHKLGVRTVCQAVVLLTKAEVQKRNDPPSP